jgi:hypothetical protein
MVAADVSVSISTKHAKTISDRSRCGEILLRRNTKTR